MDSLCGCYISRVLPRFGEYDTLREEVDWIHEFLFSGEGQSLHDKLERLYRYFAEGESIAKFRIRNTLPMRNKCIDVISILAEHIASFVVDESRLITTILAKRQTISEFQKNNKLFVNLESIQQCAMLIWTADQLGDEGYETRVEAVKAGDNIHKQLGL